MSISDNLRRLMNDALFDPSKEKKELTIRTLCEEIEKDNIVLPVFQTYIRWTDDKVVELFNYQLSGKAPIAPISMNKIDDPTQVIEQMSFLTRKVLEPSQIIGKLSVADGQQRLSTNYKAYINHPDFQNIVLDLRKGRFVANEKGVLPSTHQIPVGILYNKEYEVFSDYVKNTKFLKREDVKEVLSEVRRKHFVYSYSVNYATNLSREEQMLWFEVLNLAGSQVTEPMVYLADLLVKGVDFYKDYAIPFSEMLEEYGMGGLFPRKSAEVSIPLAALNPAFFKITNKEKTNNSSPIPSDAKAKQIGKCEVEQIREMIEITLKSLKNVLEFIDKTEEIKVPDRIDIITYLIGLFVENNISDISKMNDSQKEFIKYWINTSNFVNNSNKQRREKYEDLLNEYQKVEKM